LIELGFNETNFEINSFSAIFRFGIRQKMVLVLLCVLVLRWARMGF